jgi:hypothetical protein
MINLNENPTSGYNSFSVGVQFFGVILNVQFLHKKIKKTTIRNQAMQH